MHTHLQNLYRDVICLPKGTLTTFPCVKIFLSRIWKGRYTKKFVTIYVLASQRDTPTIQWTVWIFLHNMDSALQIVFTIVVYSRNNVIRNYTHRCHEETLRTLRQHPTAPNTTQLLDVVIDSTCADGGAIPCSSHKLSPTKCLWAWIQLVCGVYTVNDFKWGVSPATSWQFSSRSLPSTIFAMLMCYYNMHIDYPALTLNS